MMLEKYKYIFVYNGMNFGCNSIEELAEKFFGLKIYRGENGNWFVQLNGNPKTMEYCSTENDERNGYTENEVEKDFLCHHFNYKYANTALYKICE